MKSVQEMNDFLDQVDCGEAIFNITNGWGDDIDMRMDNWEYKSELTKSKDWLERCAAQDMRRRFSIGENKMVLQDKERIIGSLCRHIRSAVIDAALETSPADQPKRTKAYKNIVDMAHSLERNDAYINDILPVMNYYYGAKTDSKESENMKVHGDNAFALLEILRKKHGKK